MAFVICSTYVCLCGILTATQYFTLFFAFLNHATMIHQSTNTVYMLRLPEPLPSPFPLPSFLVCFRPFFLASFLPSLLPSILPRFLPTFPSPFHPSLLPLPFLYPSFTLPLLRTREGDKTCFSFHRHLSFQTAQSTCCESYTVGFSKLE